MPQRYDKIELNNVEKGDNGFLVYDLVAAQAGVFPYYDWQLGKVVMELKHPDDLLTDGVLKQLDALPITEDHPYCLVTIDNAKEFIKGMTQNASKINGNKLESRGTVFDAALIGKILNGTKKECSLGFQCDMVDESGEYSGVRYDRRQTNFKLNHLAMVSKARCGPECTVKEDSQKDYAEQIRHDEIDEYTKIMQRRVENTMKIKLDGAEYDVPEVVGARLQTLEQKNDDLTKQVGQLEGKLDGKDDEIKKLKEKKDELEKNQLSTEKMDEAVQAKLELMQNVSPILGDSYDFKGKTERQIKIDCITAINGNEFKADGKSDDYINARFDTICEFSSNQEFSSTGSNNLRFRDDSRASGIEAMRSKRLEMKK